MQEELQQLKNLVIKQQQLIELQNQKLQQEDHSSASVYQIKIENETIYVGKDCSKIQNRFQQHLAQRRKIVEHYQLIDIYLATLPENEIQCITNPCTKQECDQLETDLIEELQPQCNISKNNRTYICNQCDPPKIYKMRLPFDKHLKTH